MAQVIVILNDAGEGTGFLAADGKITGSYRRAYRFEPGPHVEIIARQFVKEHKGVTAVGGVEREFDFGYEIAEAPGL